LQLKQFFQLYPDADAVAVLLRDVLDQLVDQGAFLPRIGFCIVKKN
jgi:hypothetical protein